MRKLIKKILKESDELDWIKNVPDNVSFDDAETRQTYKIKTTEVFKEVLKACEVEELLYKTTTATVISKDMYSKYNNVFCGHKREDEVPSLNLMFSLPNNVLRNFWVTEDMVTLYPLR
jgi:hypothetical protein